jgi:hypothetical protein
MNSRILKKILKRKNHPRHEGMLREFTLRVEQSGRAECVRLGIDPDNWSTYTLRVPPILKRMIHLIGSNGFQ